MDSSSYTKTVANTPARSPFSPTSSLGGTTAWTKVWSRLYIWNEWWRNWIITGIPKLYYLEFIKLTSQRKMKYCQDKAKQIPTYSHCSVHCVSQKWVTTKKKHKKTRVFINFEVIHVSYEFVLLNFKMFMEDVVTPFNFLL